MSINLEPVKRGAVASAAVPEKPGTLQRFLFWWFVLAVLWLIVGKSLFGAVGWVTAVMVFTVAPLLLIYAAFIWLIATVRHKRTGYLMSRTLKVLVLVALANLFLYGLVMVDGGDTRESGRSALSSLVGINLANGADHPVMNFSEWASGKSLFASILLLPTIVILFVYDKGQRTTPVRTVKGQV